MSCEFGLLNSETGSNTVTFEQTLLDNTDYFTVNVIGGNYGNIFDIVLDQSNKTFRAKAMNLTARSHTVTVRVLIECFKELI